MFAYPLSPASALFDPSVMGMRGDGYAMNLQNNRYLFISGHMFGHLLDVDPHQIADFSNLWNGLTLDQYMADGGTYRYRRFGAFTSDLNGQRTLLPHGPYEQPKYINPLNGGAPRHFDPLETSFSQHMVLDFTLNWLTNLFNYCETQLCRWNICLHPYRILANPNQPGLPTPEGLHRDGVDYIVSMMIRRRNIHGGVSTVTDSSGRGLAKHMLMNPLDILIADDRCTMHAVTPISPVLQDAPAYRDVLVIAFNRI